MPLSGAHSAEILVTEPLAPESHCSAVGSPTLVLGEFAASPAEWTVF